MEWAALTPDRKTLLRTYASGMLDDRIEWAGIPRDWEQARAFPRWGIYTRQGTEIDDVPQELVHATARLALHVEQADTEGDSAVIDLDIRQSGPTQFGGGQRRRVIPSEIIELIPSHWIVSLNNGAATTTKLVR